MSVKTKKPEIIKLSSMDLDGVKSRLCEATLAESDKKIILSILTTYQWLYAQLETAKFSLHRVKKMFGFTTEKLSSKKKSQGRNALNSGTHSDDASQLPQLPEQPLNNGEPAQKKQ